MEKAVQLLLDVSAAALREEVLPADFANEIDAQTVEQLIKIAKTHDLSHLLSHVFTKSKLSVGDAVQQQFFFQQHYSAVMRYERFSYELKRICDVLEQAEIPHIPLKGSVLRKYYPEPWMRTSCDIDILVHPEDIERAKQAVIQELGYEFVSKGRHDLGFFSESRVHFELHYSLIESDAVGQADKPLEKVWKYATPAKGKSFQYVLSDGMFYYYHLAHMAKHFVQGGCGIRPFMDIWILQHRMDSEPKERERLLKKGGILAFERQSAYLTEVWFGSAQHTEISQQMQEYLLGAGVYGSLSNRVAVEQIKKGGKLQYAWTRIWLPYDRLRFHYPILEKQKWLFPLFQVRRWGKLIFCGGLARSTKELNATSKTSPEKIKRVSNLLRQIGL